LQTTQCAQITASYEKRACRKTHATACMATKKNKQLRFKGIGIYTCRIRRSKRH